ncbi:MAG: glycosyltransferase [Bacteroidales bacterium]|jgi:glycosyltransferase involved in cell wall biosynthesis|nr:glycosyltransferase [Bacteroidales bacterium]
MILSTEPLHIILLALLLSAALIQGWYWLRYYRAAARGPNGREEAQHELPPLSVVICARNEADNLKLFLPSVLEQDYPLYEVVVVNDCSEDSTFDVLGEMLKQYPHLRVSIIQKDPGFTHTKKLAMLIGIKAAKNDLLVFTDADCRPASPFWLREVAAAAAGDADIIIGYGAYEPDGGILNRYIRYETMFTAMQYFGMAMAGVPYMGVGRNLAYRRSFFFEKGGFGPHNHIMSGDDDLFVNRNATPDNVIPMLSRDSFTISVAEKSIASWVKQKRRHFLAAAYYKKNDKVRLFLEPFSRVAWYGLLVTLALMTAFWPVVLTVALARLVMRSVILKRASVTFNEPGLWFNSLFFDILAPLINGVLYLSAIGRGRRMKTWK